MKKLLSLNIATLLSLLAAVSSCTNFSDHDLATGKQQKNLFISGVAVDIATGKPIEEIQITMTATELYDSHEGRVVTKSTYTNNFGLYTIAAEGFSEPLTCVVKAEDPNGIYLPATSQEVMVSWQGMAYDAASKTFFVNECNFYMEKK